MLNCSCCGTEITSPYFYDGGVYGYTCIKKVHPTAGKRKSKSKTVEVDLLRIYFKTSVPKYGQAVIQFKSGLIKKIDFLKMSKGDGETYIDEIEDNWFAKHNEKYWLSF